MNSAKTARNMVPAIFRLVGKHYGWNDNTINLDLGGGPFETFTKALYDNRITSFVHDPFNRERKHNERIEKYFFRSHACDTVTISNVFNVISTWPEKYDLIYHAQQALRPGGHCYITVYEGDRSGIGRPTRDGWQENMKTVEYLPFVKEIFNDVRRHGKLIVGVK